MREQVRRLAEQVHREVKNAQDGFNLLYQYLPKPIDSYTKKIIDDSIRALVFASEGIIKDLQRNGK
jgi:hypothetical protein